MGLLDSLFGGMEASGKLNPQEAFAGVLLGASACDGHIADDEVAGLVTTLIRMKLFSRFTDKQYNQMLNKLHGMLKKKGVDFLVDQCAEGLPGELRETAFANACDIVLADGVVEQDEKEFIEKLHRKLNIDKKLAGEIAQIMVVKNKG
jgi:tellurite resistance protein